MSKPKIKIKNSYQLHKQIFKGTYKNTKIWY